MTELNLKDDFIYISMLKHVFQEYCDLCMTYLPEDRIPIIQEIGRTKAHTQKKRVKDGLKEIPKAKHGIFIAGCYDELKYQLLRQLYRTVLVPGPETDELVIKSKAAYDDCVRFLTEKIEDEKKLAVEWVKSRKDGE